MASQEYETIAALMAQVDSPLRGARSPDAMRQEFEALMTTAVVPDDVELAPVLVGRVPAVWVRPLGASQESAVLYLHGGGYAIGSPSTHRGLTSHLAERLGIAVLVPDYRLAPEDPHPAAVDDAVASYQSLLELGIASDRIALAGDSAGGGLTIATLAALRERGLPQPAAAVTISPWIDLECTGASMTSRADVDVLVQIEGLKQMADWYAGFDLTAPLASPLYADLSGLAPLLIHVGDAEILLDDSIRLADRARVAGVEVALDVWPEMMHVWHLLGPQVPEAEAAVTQIADWLRPRLGP